MRECLTNLTEKFTKVVDELIKDNEKLKERLRIKERLEEELLEAYRSLGERCRENEKELETLKNESTNQTGEKVILKNEPAASNDIIMSASLPLNNSEPFESGYNIDELMSDHNDMSRSSTDIELIDDVVCNEESNIGRGRNLKNLFIQNIIY